MWNETRDERRSALIAEMFTPEATYTDPLGAVHGHEGIDGFIAGAQAQFAGLSFSLPAAPDAHHDLARFQWHPSRGPNHPRATRAGLAKPGAATGIRRAERLEPEALPTLSPAPRGA